MLRRIALFSFLILGSCLHTHAQICPAFSLGPDTLVQCGGSIVLSGPAGYGNGNRLWSTGTHTQNITVTQAGTYWCRVTDTLSNVVQNPQFNSSTPSFTSSYTPGTGGPWGLLSYEGSYAITTNMNLVHSNFPWCYDHTSGNGTSGMLVVNGSSALNQIVWSQNVPVQPNTNYIFSCWMASADPGSPAILKFNINNMPLGNTIYLTSTTCYWQNFYIIWNSGVNTTATISLVNQNTASGGNDFAVDDILFAPICVMTDTVHVQFQGPPTVSVSDGDTICPGDSITLTASSNFSTSVFTWTPTLQQADSITVSPPASTWYHVIATNGNCTSGPDSALVTVMTLPDLQVSGGTSICPGGNAVLNATVSGGWGAGVSVWMPGAQSGTTISVSPSATTTYTCTVTDRCITDSAWVDVIVYPVTVLQAAASVTEGCMPLCTEFTLSPVVQAMQWDLGDGTLSSLQQPSHCYTDADTYDIQVQATDINGCAASLSLPGLITVHPLPMAMFTTDPGYISSTDPNIQFTNTSIDGSIFQWDLGDGTYSNEENPLHAYLNVPDPDVPVAIQLIVVNEFGCSDTVTSFLEYHNLVTFFLPNAFTPNGDGTNDFYVPKGAGIRFTDAMVYNRWGELVFSSNALMAGWDGKDQRSGEACPEGVYSYRIWVQDMEGKEYVFTERITLLR